MIQRVQNTPQITRPVIYDSQHKVPSAKIKTPHGAGLGNQKQKNVRSTNEPAPSISYGVADGDVVTRSIPYEDIVDSIAARQCVVNACSLLQ
jgi:hypothetical protein